MDMSIGNFNYPTSYEYFNCENKGKKKVVINKADTGLKRGGKFMYFVNLFII
jgi:hypothetical protein